MFWGLYGTRFNSHRNILPLLIIIVISCSSSTIYGMAHNCQLESTGENYIGVRYKAFLAEDELSETDWVLLFGGSGFTLNGEYQPHFVNLMIKAGWADTWDDGMCSSGFVQPQATWDNFTLGMGIDDYEDGTFQDNDIGAWTRDQILLPRRFSNIDSYNQQAPDYVAVEYQVESGGFLEGREIEVSFVRAEQTLLPQDENYFMDPDLEGADLCKPNSQDDILYRHWIATFKVPSLGINSSVDFYINASQGDKILGDNTLNFVWENPGRPAIESDKYKVIIFDPEVKTISGEWRKATRFLVDLRTPSDELPFNQNGELLVGYRKVNYNGRPAIEASFGYGYTDYVIDGNPNENEPSNATKAVIDLSYSELSTPVLIDPIADKEGVGTTLWLDWQESDGATSYKVQVDNNQLFGSPEFSQDGITDTHCFVTGLDYAQTYYWRVKARNASTSSDWSEKGKFTTMSEPPVVINHPNQYVLAYLEESDQYYTDREYVINSIPSDLRNLLWIKTANDDQYDTSNSLVSITLDKSAKVYIAYDHRGTSVPDWLNSQFTQTGYNIEVSDQASLLNVWSKQFTPGTYTFGGNLATGASGAKSNYVIIINVLPLSPPIAEFEGVPLEGPQPLTVTFTEKSVGEITSWSWSFGDGEASSLQNPVHTFQNAGIYTVSLSVTGPGGSDTEIKTNYITVNEVTSFFDDFEDGNDNGWTRLTASRWQVDQNDGDYAYFLNTSNYEPNPQDRLGEYSLVSGLFWDDFTFSCDVRSAENMSSNLHADYAIVFGYTDAQNYSFVQVKKNNVSFWSIVNNVSNTIEQFSLSMSNDEFSHNHNITIQKNNSTVTVVVSYEQFSATGSNFKTGLIGVGSWNDSTWFDNVSVNKDILPLPPIAAFSADITKGSVPLTVNFTDSSIGDITSWSWDFGDSETLTEQNPVHIYNETGVYTVSLTVCTVDTQDKEIKVDYINVYTSNIDSGLVAYYPFNGNVNDESGNENHGTNYGAASTYDRFGNNNSACRFDGINNRIQIPNNVISGHTLTTILWAKTDDKTYGLISGANASNDNEYLLYVQESHGSKLEIYYHDDKGASGNGFYSTNITTNDNLWHMITVVTELAETKVYIDGILAEVCDYGSNTSFNIEGLWLGAEQDAVNGGWKTSQQFNGIFDDIRIYNRALNEEEINLLYDETSAIIYLSIASLDAFPMDTVIVPVNVIFPEDSSYSSAEIVFSGFQGQLDFVDVVTDSSLIGDAGWDIEVNNTDTLVITASAETSDISGSGVLFRLRYAVPAFADTGFIPITIESARFNNGGTPVDPTSGGVNILIPVAYGDVDLNGLVQAYDASLILKYLVGNITLTPQQLLNANVSSDATISSLDVSLILRYLVGLIESLPYTGPSSYLYASGIIEMSNNYINPGHIVEIPLQLSTGENIYSFQGEITYDPTNLKFKEVAWPQSFNNFIIETNDNPAGIIRFSGANTKPRGGHGTFVTLRFLVNDLFNGDSTVVKLKNMRWNEGKVISNAAHATLHNLTGITEFQKSIPSEFQLLQNHPNPFNPSTLMEYSLPKAGNVTLKIFNVLGEEIITLVECNQPAGIYRLEWDGKDDLGSQLKSGIYVYQITAGDFVATRKMMLIK